MTNLDHPEPMPVRDDVPLADLQDEIIDPEKLGQLLFDIETEAELIDIRVKGGAMAQASVGAGTLVAARTLLEGASVLGVQLRYRWRGVEWWDTLLRSPGGIRLIRIQHAG